MSKTIIAIIIIIIVAGIGYWLYQSTLTPEEEGKETEETEETEKAYILTLMDQISDIIGIDRDPTPTEAMAITIKWNNEKDEEMEYNGIGYAVGDVMGSEIIINKRHSINELLMQEGLHRDDCEQYSRQPMPCDYPRSTAQVKESLHRDYITKLVKIEWIAYIPLTPSSQPTISMAFI